MQIWVTYKMGELSVRIKEILDSFNGELAMVEKMTIKDLDTILLEEF